MKDCDRTSFLGLHNIVRLFSVVGFFALTMSAINAEDSQCCGAENVNDLSDIKVREIPNVKRSSKSNHYGPYELDYSNEASFQLLERWLEEADSQRGNITK